MSQVEYSEIKVTHWHLKLILISKSTQTGQNLEQINLTLRAAYTCAVCDMHCIGQRERTFKTRCKEKAPNNRSHLQSKQAKHLRDMGHSYTNIHKHMEVLNTSSK